MGSGIWLQARGLRICAYSFSTFEVVTLINVLIIKYQLSCTMQMDKDKPVVYIPKRSQDLLLPIVKPYMITSTFYMVDL